MLGIGGAALQGYLRNPLAEPSVLRASNMAALGAVIAFYFGLATAFPPALPLLALAGAVIALAPLMLLARQSHRDRNSVGSGKSVPVRVDLGRRPHTTKK